MAVGMLEQHIGTDKLAYNSVDATCIEMQTALEKEHWQNDGENDQEETAVDNETGAQVQTRGPIEMEFVSKEVDRGGPDDQPKLWAKSPPE